MHHKLGYHTQALADYDKTIELNPKDAMAYTHRAQAYHSLGDSQAAAQDELRAEEIRANGLEDTPR